MRPLTNLKHKQTDKLYTYVSLTTSTLAYIHFVAYMDCANVSQSEFSADFSLVDE